MSKEHRSQKIFLKLLVVLAVSGFVVINIVWFFKELKPYLYYQDRLNGKVFAAERDRLLYDGENYCYYVCYPTYLRWCTGNLSIAAPLEEKEVLEDGQTLYVANNSLLIWLNDYDGSIRDIGVTVELNDRTYDVYVENSTTARYPDQQWIVDETQEAINMLFTKAEEAWGIEMPWGE